MFRLTFKGNHYQIGVTRGKFFLENKVTFPLFLDDFQFNHGKESEKILRKYFPEICQEIKGVCDTIKVDYLQFVSWMLCMGCCMYNLNDNTNNEIRGCSAFAYVSKGQVIYGRNNDLIPSLKDVSKNEVYLLDNNIFSLTTSSFINGEEGINKHGLVVAMTFVLTDLKEIKPGFNSCFIVRYLLEKAKNTKQAYQLLKQLPVASNCNILLADKSGDMLVVECSPQMKKKRIATQIGNTKVVCCTNCFISDEMKSYDYARGNDYQAYQRYLTVMNNIDKLNNNKPIETTQRLLKGEYGFMCQYDDVADFETVWSSIFDLNSLMMYQSEGDPRVNNYIKDDRLYNLNF
ncbi:MAG: C45 family autoproteolytic acyltransferase/hydrolase [Thomasclavelia sp.]